MERGKRIKRIIRVARATIPEAFDLKDELTKVCLNGHIDEDEVKRLETCWQDLWRSLGQAKVEEVEA